MFKQISPALKISIIYFLISFIWILTSDNLLNLFTKNIETLNSLQTIKGWLFITFTSFVIYILIDKYFKKEKILREETEDIFNHASIPIVVFTEDGKARKLNKAWENLTGYTLNEINTMEKWAKKAYGNKSEKIIKIFQSYYNIEKSMDVGEFKIKTKNNNFLIWHYKIAPYGRIDGKKCFIVTALDITELRENERLLVQQSKMATMGEMIGNIAHQWKQPLSLIRLSNGMIKFNVELSDYKDKDVDKAVIDIDNSVLNLSETIDDFKNFFNPNKLINNFNIKDIFDKTFKLLNTQLKDNNIEVITNYKDINIYGLQNELLQVLINIIKNAKEELVKVPTDKRRLLFVEAIEDNNDLVIKIKDNANGIPENIIDKVFDSYFTTKESSNGTGIGLYMSRQIIEKNMFGSITAFNEEYKYEKIEYKGAVFKITIPLKYSL